MKSIRFMILALLCAVAQGAWAQPGAKDVDNETDLRNAVKNNGIIRLKADIMLSGALIIDVNGTVGIDLNGFTLNRGLTNRGDNGQVISVRSGSTLTLANGTLTGGWGGNSGGVLNDGTVQLTGVTITGCTGDDRGGGISNNGTLTMTGGALIGNISNDRTAPEGGGGIFNYEGATATLTGVTITGNEAKVKGGGGICNYGTMTLDGCTITGNTCGKNGGGIYNAACATLKMQGAMTVTGNTTAGDETNNLFLKTDALINVTGALSGSTIGIIMETPGVFTSGYNTYNEGVDPATIFSSDDAVFYVMRTADETCLALDYVECSWDDESKIVKSEIKTLASGNYTVLKGGGDIDLQPGYYIVKSNVTYGTINMKGSGTHHLILCDGARIKANFVHIIDDDVLHIYGQTNSSGQLIIDEPLLNCAGIGCTSDESVGTIVIHGGDISAHSDGGSAGIGSSNYSSGSHGSSWRVPRHRSDLSSADDGTITIYDGTVKAYGGTNGSGIGGGRHTRSGTITINGGKVYAYGGDDAAGIGGGWDTSGYSLVVNGGYVEAHGGGNGAGIGSGSVQIDNGKNVVGGEVTINGGEVYAYGGVDAAGIGGGEDGHGGTITITGGYVYAEGNDYGSAIGGGQDGDGGNITITGGTVIAKAGANAPGAIGGGEDGEHGSLTLGDDRCAYITNNLWRCKKENRVNDCWGAAYLQISKCLHGDATASIVDGEKHDISSCKWCYVTGEEAHTFRDYGECDACHLISLADNASNGEVLSTYDGKLAQTVTLSGRTLWKDNKWNTLCLPFDASLTGDLAGATLMELDTDAGSYAHITGFENGTLYLNFKTATSIEAGKPYIIKWASGSNITNPVFSNVTISDTRTEVESADGTLAFAGAFSPLIIGLENKSLLFLGGNNTLYYPQPADAEHPITIGSCRAHFRLKGIEAGDPSDPSSPVKAFVLNFDGSDDATSMYDEQCTMYDGSLTPSLSEGEGAIYNLAGQRLSKMQRGINIVNGEKILVGPHGHSVK